MYIRVMQGKDGKPNLTGSNRHSHIRPRERESVAQEYGGERERQRGVHATLVRPRHAHQTGSEFSVLALTGEVQCACVC